MPVKAPRALSVGEETLALHLRAHGIDFEREYVFAPPRKWRFDFAIKPLLFKIAVEVDGGTAFGKSRHSRGAGYENDCRKMNTAMFLGWRVLRFTTNQVERGEAIADVLAAIGATEPV